LKILVLSQDISLLNIVDYILYKDYKVVKSTSIENLESGIDDFNLIIFDFNYWLNNYPAHHSENLKKIPLIILTEDKSSDALRAIKQEYQAKIILKEPLVKKDLKEAIKDLLKKKKSKKNKEEYSVKVENIESQSESIIDESDVVAFRTNDFDQRKIEYISGNFYKLTGKHDKPVSLSEIIHPDDINRFADIKISADSPVYSLVYRIITAHNKEIILKETGKANFDGRDYLTNVEGTLYNYTAEYIKENLILFLSDIFSQQADNTEALLTKIVNDFASIPFFRNQIQLSIAFSNKHYFAAGFEATDYSISTPIEQDGKNTGEVILFANDDNNNVLDDSLKAFTDLLKNFILLYSSYYRQHSSAKSQIETLTNEFNTLVNEFSQTKSALADKTKSFDNLNEIFSSATKDYKILNSKLNRSIVIFETNNTGKFLSANENYYRAIEGQRDHIVGKHFDELFENINWESLQFEFFNNANQEINLKQKSKQGKAHYFTFLISREENGENYKYVFYGNDKTDVKSLQIELAKQVTSYNNTVNEFVQLKDKNTSLENENTILKEELRALKEAQLKATEESVIEREKEIEETQIEQAEETTQKSSQENIESPAEELPDNEEIFKNLRGIDFNKGLESAHNNMDTYNEILVNFLNDYSEFIDDVKENHLTNQKDEILSKLQILSEEAGYIGAEDLDNSARLFHDKLNDNKVTNFDFELSVLGVHLNFTLESIKKYKAEYSLEHHPKVDEENSDLDEFERFDAASTDINEDYAISHKEITEDVQRENVNDIFEPVQEVTSDNRIDLLLIDIKDLLSSENSSEEISTLIKEKLFELKFHNNDIGKIEKIQELESSIETGDTENAIRALNELLKF